jgi:RNA polymerase-binding transcription factor
VNRIDAEAFRRQLLEERKRITDAIDHLHAENPGSLEDEIAEMPLDNHLAETATGTLDREIDYTLEENAEHVLTAIDAALERIDQDSFGVCTRCGRPISQERLEARPWASLCIDCKRQEERG